jgi:hypothetical protein
MFRDKRDDFGSTDLSRREKCRLGLRWAFKFLAHVFLVAIFFLRCYGGANLERPLPGE